MKQVSEAVHIPLATIITKGIMDLEIDIIFVKHNVDEKNQKHLREAYER